MHEYVYYAIPVYLYSIVHVRKERVNASTVGKVEGCVTLRIINQSSYQNIKYPAIQNNAFLF
jgi:hypothetical protein